MSEHRFEIDATAGPAREGLVGGHAMLLGRVRLLDGPGVVNSLTGEPAAGEEVVCDLRPSEARALAFTLHGVADQAKQAGGQARP
jgi:hypothetical protein